MINDLPEQNIEEKDLEGLHGGHPEEVQLVAGVHRWRWWLGQHFTENVSILVQGKGEENSSKRKVEADAEVEQCVKASPLQDFTDKSSIGANSQEDEEPFQDTQHLLNNHFLRNLLLLV